MISRFCSDCNQQSDETTWSDYFRTRLCMDCYNERCRDEGEPITLDDLDAMFSCEAE